jgi:hypothetical protein
VTNDQDIPYRRRDRRVLAAQTVWVEDRFGPAAVWGSAVDVWTGDDWVEITSAIPGGRLTSIGFLGAEVMHVADCATPPMKAQ